MAAMEPTARRDEAVAAYLKEPYTRMVVPDSDGTFRAEILEFPGCIATGDSAAAALATLEEVATDWLVLALERGQSIPEPVENAEFSGRFVLRLPRSLHKKATLLAERDGVSLNQFIVAGLAEHVGERARPQSDVVLNAAISNINAGIFIAQGNLQSFGAIAAHGATIYPSSVQSVATVTRIPRLRVDNPFRETA